MNKSVYNATVWRIKILGYAGVVAVALVATTLFENFSVALMMCAFLVAFIFTLEYTQWIGATRTTGNQEAPHNSIAMAVLVVLIVAFMLWAGQEDISFWEAWLAWPYLTIVSVVACSLYHWQLKKL